MKFYPRISIENCAWRTSGIPGGYRLVSTYDLPDFPELGGYFGVNFGHLKSEVFRRGGLFRSKLWSSQIWSFSKGRGYSGVNFGHLKSEVFRNGGYSGVNFGHHKSEIFRNGGGYSGVNFGHLKSEIFRNQGVFWSKLWSSQIWIYPKWRRGLSGLQFQKGAFWKIWTKIYCLRNVYRNVVCITDSLSHTTYAETNNLDYSRNKSFPSCTIVSFYQNVTTFSKLL